jgi:CBS domain containing-hemolysin-like protein
MSLAWSLSAVPLLIATNAFFVAAEYAVVATDAAGVDALRRSGRDRAARAIERLTAEPAGAIGAIQVCITMTNLMLGWIGEPAMTAALRMLFAPAIEAFPAVLTPVSVALGFVVVTLLTVVFSELLPKALTLRYVPAIATLTAVPVLAVRRAVGPLVWLMNAMANAVTLPLGLGRVDDAPNQRVTLEELELLARRAGQQGVLGPRERSLVLASLAIGRRKAKEIMIHRTKVDRLDLRWAMAENRQAVERHLHSRLPLCDGGMDRVVGLVQTEEFLIACQEADTDTSVLRLIARPPVFLPLNLTLDRLLNAFHEHHTRFAFLVDEHGGVTGIVTLQDLVDELLGEIRGR